METKSPRGLRSLLMYARLKVGPTKIFKLQIMLVIGMSTYGPSSQLHSLHASNITTFF